MSPNLTKHRQRGSAKTVVEALRRFRRVLITAHIRPDGDAVGSSIAMARMLKANGWEPTVALSPLGMGPPKFLLDYATCVAPTNVKARDYDCALLLDCGGPDRLPDPLRDAVAKLPTCVIDHHATSKPYGIARWVVPDASSTGELVYRFAARWKWEIDLPTAEALWVALVTDTGRFAYSCTHPSTLRAAADLLARGVDSSAINDRLYLYASEGAVLLKRKAYDSLTTWFRGRVASPRAKSRMPSTSLAPSPPPRSASSSTKPKTNPASPDSASAPATKPPPSPPPPSPSTSAAAATSAPPGATFTANPRPPSRPSRPTSPPSSPTTNPNGKFGSLEV